LLPFLKTELRDLPGRRLGAFRLFIIALIIALVGETLRPPHLTPVAITIALGLSPYANAGQALALGGRMFGFLTATSLVCLLTLALWGNQPWFLMPWSFCVIAASLFHSRVTGQSTHIIASWYPVVVLYNVSTPEENIYTALWLVPIMGGLGALFYVAVQMGIKPQDPSNLLQEALIQQLKSVEAVLKRRLKGAFLSEEQRTGVAAQPGKLVKNYDLLSHCALIHPAMRYLHDTYEALLVEINGLGHLAVWYESTLSASHWNPSLGMVRHRQLIFLIRALRKLKQGIASSRDVSAEVLEILGTDHNPDPTGHTVPSLLQSMHGSQERIAKLLGMIHRGERLPSHSVKPSASSLPSSIFPSWMGYTFWYTHRATLQFALKFAFAAMLCAVLIQALDWPGLGTSIVTSIVVAQTSLGANYRKSLLRFSGAALGGLLAYVYVLLAQPLLDTLVGFALVTAPVWGIAAWIAAGGTRTAYAGQQIAYAFGLFVLHDFGQVTELHTPRDRVLGILLGILVVGILDYVLWPRPSNKLAQRRVSGAIHSLTKLTAWPADEVNYVRNRVLPVRRSMDKELATALDLLSEAEFEPDYARHEQKVKHLRSMVATANELAGLLSIRIRYRLVGGLILHELPDILQARIAHFDAALSQALEYAANVLQGGEAVEPAGIAQVLADLETSAHEWYATSKRSQEIAHAVELRMSLDRQIVRYIDTLVQNVNQC